MKVESESGKAGKIPWLMWACSASSSLSPATPPLPSPLHRPPEALPGSTPLTLQSPESLHNAVGYDTSLSVTGECKTD
ncbi:hypothetical protein E2C01_030313 [Portunus trituberculatus]|uniref:Uncharacterized protein n=1 Tax=Portunus trituberculatus TaxID=210409 RepID=A0A5B7EUI9_PORTR|nr:hypothetical protein [Portunus trituberculatus]